MSGDQKRELAEKVVDQTVMHRMKITSDSNGSNPQLTEKFRSQMREQQIDLYCKHFEIEQLQALLDFYSTEMGKSILESQKRLSGDISSGLRIERSTIETIRNLHKPPE